MGLLAVNVTVPVQILPSFLKVGQKQSDVELCHEGVTVGEAGFDNSVFCPTYLSSDIVALDTEAADS
jgi:hypothetical protein